MKKLLLILLSTAILLPLAHAQTTWTGGGADNLWSNPLNWSDGVPVSGSNATITFNGTTRTTTFNDLVGFTLNGPLRMESTATWTLEGNAITLGASGTIQGPTPANNLTHEIDFNIDLANTTNRFFQVNGNNININGLITGTAATGDFTLRNFSGNVTLTNENNSFLQRIGAWTTTLIVSKLENAGTNSTIGAGDRILIGNTEGTGTLSYVGNGSSTNRTIRVGNGNNNATWTGGATILNNGTGALNFTASGDFNAATSSTAARVITLGGSYDGTNTISGVVRDNTGVGGTIGVTVSNSTWSLNGTNTYTGNTTVTAGTLLINGSTTANSTVTVGANGTLGGNGTIGGAVTVAGNLRPGNSTAVLSFGSNLTLTSTANTTMQINGITRGTDYDGINVTSGLTYDGTLTLALGTTFGVGNYTFNLFDFGSQSGEFDAINLTGLYSGSLAGPGDVWSLTSGVNTWSFTHSTGDLGLTVIPEPSTWALIAVSLTALVILRRRRHA